jgi:hypothetical protein
MTPLMMQISYVSVQTTQYQQQHQQLYDEQTRLWSKNL